MSPNRTYTTIGVLFDGPDDVAASWTRIAARGEKVGLCVDLGPVTFQCGSAEIESAFVERLRRIVAWIEANPRQDAEPCVLDEVEVGAAS